MVSLDNRYKLPVLLVTCLFAVGMVSAQSISDNERLAAEQATPDNEAFTLSEPETSNFFDRLLSSLGNTLSLVTGQATYQPGDTVTFTAEHGPNEDGVGKSLDEVRFVVGVYKCTPDNDCSDPNEFVSSATQGFTVLSGSLDSAARYTMDVEYSIPSDAQLGDYDAVSYLWWAGPDGEFGTGDEQVVSDTSTTKFSVESTSDGTDDTTDDTDDTDTGSADIEVVSEPSISEIDNGFRGSVTLENTGSAAMEQSNVVEMQVRPQGAKPLSFVSEQRTCDDSHPENVHKSYQLDAGDQRQINLVSTENLVEDQRYTIYFLTRDSCWTADDPAERVEPYPNSYRAGTFCLGTCEQNEEGASTVFIIASIVGVVAVLAGAVILYG